MTNRFAAETYCVQNPPSVIRQRRAGDGWLRCRRRRSELWQISFRRRADVRWLRGKRNTPADYFCLDTAASAVGWNRAIVAKCVGLVQLILALKFRLLSVFFDFCWFFFGFVHLLQILSSFCRVSVCLSVCRSVCLSAWLSAHWSTD